MKITVTHSTIYRYDFPVFLEPHIFRFRPRTNSAQKLLAFDLQISPTPAGTTECLDQDGTLGLNAWFNTSTSELSVLSQFSVQLLRENPFDYLLLGESLQLPLWYREPLCAALAPYRQDALVAESVKQYAKSAAVSPQGTTLSFLTGVEPANLSDLPADRASRRSSLVVRSDLAFDGGILPGFGGAVLRRVGWLFRTGTSRLRPDSTTIWQFRSPAGSPVGRIHEWKLRCE